MTNGQGAVRWWVPGDWNGFFGLFTNVLLNVNLGNPAPKLKRVV